MTQHGLPWPWPTLDEADRLMDLLREPGHPRMTDHRETDAIHIEHDDGRSLWATYLDAPDGDAPDPISSLVFPIVADTRAELEDRVSAIRREAQVHGVRVRQFSLIRYGPHLDRKITALVEEMGRHREGRT